MMMPFFRLMIMTYIKFSAMFFHGFFIHPTKQPSVEKVQRKNMSQVASKEYHEAIPGVT